ncbi:hypothetical protein DAEQUDRAFT_221903 [Daedalea quercina L-15889]|uniref:Uncharacterized protein n=1 Tax=Daedalea quercina L-15889 TaxID=1314783 RepID=A0A165KGZ4_9APHY|nr:hypothetical protein DAEQUDRAFT_221903 [Daedalea quercina L-15889]
MRYCGHVNSRLTRGASKHDQTDCLFYYKWGRSIERVDYVAYCVLFGQLIHPPFLCSGIYYD